MFEEAQIKKDIVEFLKKHPMPFNVLKTFYGNGNDSIEAITDKEGKKYVSYWDSQGLAGIVVSEDMQEFLLAVPELLDEAWQEINRLEDYIIYLQLSLKEYEENAETERLLRLREEANGY